MTSLWPCRASSYRALLGSVATSSALRARPSNALRERLKWRWVANAPTALPYSCARLVHARISETVLTLPNGVPARLFLME
jgi:hypothetical protein